MRNITLVFLTAAMFSSCASAPHIVSETTAPKRGVGVQYSIGSLDNSATRYPTQAKAMADQYCGGESELADKEFSDGEGLFGSTVKLNFVCK